MITGYNAYNIYKVCVNKLYIIVNISCQQQAIRSQILGGIKGFSSKWGLVTLTLVLFKAQMHF